VTPGGVDGPEDKAQPRADRPTRFGPWRAELRAFLELFAIAGLAITQPVLDLLSKNVGIFVAGRTSTFEIVTLTLVVAFVPASVAWLAEAAGGAIVPRWRRWIHAVFVAGFAAILAEQAIKQATELGPTALIVAGASAAVVAGILVFRYALVRQFLRYLAFAPAAFVLLFLVLSPAAAVVSGEQPKSVSGASIENPKRVVMIVADELPLGSLLNGAGRVDADLYPNFAALAATSTWYRNTTTVSPFTEWAMPALVTGQNPSKPTAPAIAAEYPDSIFRLLGGAYEMNAHESITDLCPTTICSERNEGRGLVRSMRVLLEETKDLWWDFASPRRPPPATLDTPINLAPQLPAATRFVNSLAPSTEPTFDYLHVLLPHQPWRYFPTMQDAGYSPTDPFKRANALVWESDAGAMVGRERHIIQLQVLDVLLGQVMTRLRSIGAWDDSLVVVTADHGEAFTGRKAMRSATEETADEIMWTPLFVKAPEQTAAVVDDRPMQSIDIVPTVADMLDVKIPWKVDGVSALGKPRPEFDRPLYQWELGIFTAPGAPLAKDHEHLTFPAQPNFSEVLARRAAEPGGETALRPYRIGEYGRLVGQTASPFVDSDAAGPTNVVVDRDLFSNVDPTARYIPWTWVNGFVTGIERHRYLAFAVNGRIAGIGPISAFEGTNDGFYAAVLAPQFFVPGANDVKAYAVSGPPGQPVLTPVPMSG